MKGVVLKQLQQAPGLVNRVLASAKVAAGDCKPAGLFTARDGGARGMATGADIMCSGSSSSSTAAKRQDTKAKAEQQLRVSGVGGAVTTSASNTAVGVEARVVHVAPQASPARQKWWRPDPATGTWVPEGSEGKLTTNTDVTKSASRVIRVRSDITASLEDKRWWTSMEELPDMDRANPK